MTLKITAKSYSLCVSLLTVTFFLFFVFFALCLQTRQKVLVTAFLRALKDPFPPARSAAIGSLTATQGYYTTGDVAGRILPALCTLTVDKEKNVRDQVFTTIKMFLGKMEKLSEDPQAAAEQEKAESKCV